LDSVNRVLRKIHWTSQDVIARFAGLRTFPRTDGETASLSREWTLAEPYPGVLASIGGKYTSARADSAKLVARACSALGRDPGPCPTTWREFPWRPEEPYRKWQRATLGQALRLGVDEETAQACQLRYGKRIEVLLRLIEKMPKLAQRYVVEAPVCLGELVYCSQYEMVGGLHDLLRRRLPLTVITELTRERVELAARVAGRVLRWPDERRAAEVRSICGEQA
jgi:glycerol-3-phosphate dehydrogenase